MENTSKKIPKCVGFIMDGNRRFAKERSLPTMEGHTAGFKKFTEVMRWVKESQISHGVFYAFSTENWRRSPEEVNHLMKLFVTELKNLRNNKNEEGVSFKFIGRRRDFSSELQTLLSDLEEQTAHLKDCTIWVALSYGGRAEIVEAVNLAIKQTQAVSEESFTKLLWSSQMPEPDLIIRTGGEQRLSNFLTWHSVYSELFFIDTYWPAFTKEEFTRILAQYGNRQRRKGA